MTDRPVPPGVVPPCTQVDPNLWLQALLAGLCGDCPARTQCRDFAAERDLPGWWGGTTDAQRRRSARRAETRQALPPEG